MSAQRDPLAGIDFSKPIQISEDDVSFQEMDRFLEATGEELVPFIRAIESGNVNPQSLPETIRGRRAMAGLFWIWVSRQRPDVTFDQIYSTSIGRLTDALDAITVARTTAQSEQLQPMDRSRDSVATNWQNG